MAIIIMECIIKNSWLNSSFFYHNLSIRFNVFYMMLDETFLTLQTEYFDSKKSKLGLLPNHETYEKH